MTITTILVRLFTTFFPLIKEYLSSSDRRKDFLSVRAVTFWVLLAVTLLSVCTVYLAEQARNNIDVHKPIVTQYNTVYVENQHLKKENKRLVGIAKQYQNQLQGQFVHPVLDSSANEVYRFDPKTNTMVLSK